MDLDVSECAKDGTSLKFLGLTKPHSGVSYRFLKISRALLTVLRQASAPQSMLKIRFVSLILPETNAKESRVKVTLSGFTYTVHADLDWISDLGRFAKAPPDVRLFRS